MDEAAGMSATGINTLKIQAHAALATIEGGRLPDMLSSSENGLEDRPSGTAAQLAGGAGEDDMVSFLP